MAKRKTAKKKTAKRARAAKSTTVTTMTTKTTKTTRTTRQSNPLRLGKQDKAVIRAFTEQRAADGHKLTTDGERLDGMWMGGNGIAEWKGGKIRFHDIGSKAAVVVQHAVRAEAPKNDLVGGGTGWTGGDDPTSGSKNPAKGKTFEVGDLVRYTANFLRSTGQYASKRQDGVVVGIAVRDNGAPDPEFVIVSWNDYPAPTRINAANIEKKKTTASRELLLANVRAAIGIPVGEPRGAYTTWSRGTRGEGRHRKDWFTPRSGMITVPADAVKHAVRLHDDEHVDTLLTDPNGDIVFSMQTYEENPGDDPEILIDRDAAIQAMGWHGGQGTALYSLASSAIAGRPVPRSTIEAAATDLRVAAKKVKARRDKRDALALAALLDAYAEGREIAEMNPAALLYSERTMIVVEEEEQALQRNPAKGSGKAPTFTKVADRVYVGRGAVKGEDVYGKPRSWSVDFRIDGRDGDFYRVDMHTLGPWEAIDGGEQSAPKTLPAARAMVAAWLAAASEQHTLSPRLESRAWVRGRAANPAPTERQIRSLLYEAGEHGDLVMAHICRVALGDEEPVVTADEFEDRYGGGGFDEYERKQIMDVGSQAEAIVICEEAIASARARRERNPAPAREKNPRLASLSRRISGV